VNAQRIFVSGVAGFLGSHLADAFLDDGHHVVGIDNMLGGELATLSLFLTIFLARVINMTSRIATLRQSSST